MTVYSEETLPIAVGLGIDSYNHPANIADGFCTSIHNFVAKKDRLITRKGFQPYIPIDTRTDYSESSDITHGLNCFYSKIPNSRQFNWPIAMWGTGSDTWMMRQFPRVDPANISTSASVVKLVTTGSFKGACTYLDRFYINSESSGIDHVNVFDWDLGTATLVNVIGPVFGNSVKGLFVFKDRMWCWNDTKIFYTDPPNAPGEFPEVWDPNGKFIVIGAGSGLGEIQSVIPVGTKLFVFTSSGLYNISVLGSPENWVVRLMDATIQVNHHNCAFEDKGLIYFVDTRGVWVTNQDQIKLISQPIQDVFNTGTAEETYYLWKLFPFDDGILICRQKTISHGTSPLATLSTLSEARIFYSRLDFIAWTEFTFDTVSQPGDILGAFSNIESGFNWNKTNYLVLVHGNSSPTSVNPLTGQLLTYIGYQDKLRKLSASEEAINVRSFYTSKVLRGQMLAEKRGKYAYINFSAAGNPGDDIDIDYQWDTEQEVARMADSLSVYDIISAKEGLIKIKGPEFFRNLQFNLTATLSSAIQEYTILGSALVLHTDRKTPGVNR